MLFPALKQSKSQPARAAVLTTAAVAALLALHAWLGLSGVIGQGVTADEIAHVTGGYSYWRYNDYRIQPENGNLPQRWGALPLLALQPRLDPWSDPEAWSRSEQWWICRDFFYYSGNNTDYLLFCARAAMMLWSVAAAALVFGWARTLWGTAGGLFALSLFVFSPTTLAHGPLVTSDMCAAAVLLAATAAFWQVTREITWRTLGLSCVITGLAFVAKFSCVLLLPVYTLLLCWRWWSNEPIRVQLRSLWSESASEISGRRKWLAWTALIGLHAAAAWVVIWTTFGWRFSGFAPDLPEAVKYFPSWQLLVPETGFWRWALTSAMDLKVLPEAYIVGFGYVRGAAERSGFLLGEYRINGWWWFFPYAFLAKSSIAELLAIAGTPAIALVVCLRRRSTQAPFRGQILRLHKLVPLLVFAAVYGLFSLTSTLNIGHRHILPIYLMGFILAGALPRILPAVWGRWAAVTIALMAAAESGSVRPHYLAFFNALSGGPENGWRQLVDSSFDWGQDLPSAAAWLREHRRADEPVFIAHFGSGHPYYEGIRGRELSVYYTYGRGHTWYELEPGLYCISATMLQDVYSPMAGPWTNRKEATYQSRLRTVRADLAAGRLHARFADFGSDDARPVWELDRLRFARLCTYLRVRQPEAVVGYTYFMFRLNAEEVRIVVDGSLKELAVLTGRALEARHSR